MFVKLATRLFLDYYYDIGISIKSGEKNSSILPLQYPPICQLRQKNSEGTRQYLMKYIEKGTHYENTP